MYRRSDYHRFEKTKREVLLSGTKYNDNQFVQGEIAAIKCQKLNLRKCWKCYRSNVVSVTCLFLSRCPNTNHQMPNHCPTNIYKKKKIQLEDRVYDFHKNFRKSKSVSFLAEDGNPDVEQSISGQEQGSWTSKFEIRHLKIWVKVLSSRIHNSFLFAGKYCIRWNLVICLTTISFNNIYNFIFWFDTHFFRI